MPRIRTFIALDPGKAVRDRMVILQEKLKQSVSDVKWVEPSNLHLTLLFLGDVDQRDLASVCRIVSDQTSQTPQFPMTVETAGCFPNLRRPRVLWVGVGEGAQEICTLHDAIEQPLLDLGCYRREDRKFTPHITLGRVKRDVRMDDLSAALAKRADWKAGETTVKELVVMSSELTPDGPIYTVLSRAKLA